jgi:hypothetical protein
MPLTKDRNTPRREDDVYDYAMAANAKIFAGAIVALNAGWAQPGATAAGLVAAGRADEQADNTGGANGARTVRVRRGVFKFKNSATDPITAADIGRQCFIQDDETVARTHGGNTRSPAGVIREVEVTGVWVAIGQAGI